MPSMQASGATVWMKVSSICVGEFIHLLENDADIFLLGRKLIPKEDLEIFALRSDRFPKSWEGKQVRAEVVQHRQGLTYSLVDDEPRSCVFCEAPIAVGELGQNS